ncbi:MAG TPA: NADH-quinone oxidoreductase subunit C [Rectinemataceae bacterium]|nr:NADH-quinone oxidoreductase subunit C [Rectinemataceae bacterium]
MRDAALIAEALGPELGGGVGLEADSSARELSVAGRDLATVLSGLKSLGGFVLLDIDAVDRPEGFDLSYRFLDRGGEGPVAVLTVKVRADRGRPLLPSVMHIWKSADVLEREVWDLMGVVFEGRTGLTRILCRDDFVGHPLRKDFALERPDRFPEAAESEGGRA